MLTAFTASLFLITISELGDKTFFIAMILAMRHPHKLVFSAVMAALALMTLLSVGLGGIVSLLPKIYTHYGAIALFLIFGVKLIYDATQMPTKYECAVIKEAEEAVETTEKSSRFDRLFGGRFGKALANPQLATWGRAFILTFVAEWGDRTQISTIALAAANNPVAVTIGAILGHAICTIIAVLGGRMIAGRISERVITGIGGVLFLIFGAIAYFQGY